MIDNTTKKQIASHLNNYCDAKGSFSKASRTLTGASVATISNMVNGVWTSISDDKWRSIAKQIGFDTADSSWKHADTEPYKALRFYLNDAKEHKTVFALIIHPGSGKTHTLDTFKGDTKNVIYVKCTSLMNPRIFYTDLLKSFGKMPETYSLGGIFKQLVREVIKLENPVIVIDELEKVDHKVFVQFIDIFNELEDKCGIVLLGTPNLKSKIENGNSRGRMCYNETLDRVSGKFIEVPPPTGNDVKAVAIANGIINPTDLTYIANDSHIGKVYYSLRRVKKLVHSFKLQNAA